VRSRLEVGALVLLALLVLGFVVSFVFGLARDRSEPVPVETSTDIKTPEPPAGPRVRVEVLNASGKTGLARLGMERLRSQGFDVVYFGTLRQPPTGNRSRVIDRIGDFATAQRVADALGISLVESKPDPALQLEATVVLGGDWPPEKTGTAGEAADSTRR
jgi:hypothetical protein